MNSHLPRVNLRIAGEITTSFPGFFWVFFVEQEACRAREEKQRTYIGASVLNTSWSCPLVYGQCWGSTNVPTNYCFFGLTIELWIDHRTIVAHWMLGFEMGLTCLNLSFKSICWNNYKQSNRSSLQPGFGLSSEFYGYPDLWKASYWTCYNLYSPVYSQYFGGPKETRKSSSLGR